MVRDVYPARVMVPRDAADPGRDQLARIGYLDNGRYVLRACRVVVTRERLYVWATPMGFPAVVYEREWSSPDAKVAGVSDPGNGARSVILGVDGGAVSVELDEAAGCGCGSPLKSLQPFTPYRMGPL